MLLDCSLALIPVYAYPGHQTRQTTTDKARLTSSLRSAFGRVALPEFYSGIDNLVGKDLWLVHRIISAKIYPKWYILLSIGKSMKKNKDYTVSSGNIFKDLGISNPEERLAKAELAYQINTLIKERNLTQQQAAKLLGVDQPKVSLLYQGKLSGFSLERLFNFLNLLDQKITITITPQKRSNKKRGVTITFTNLKKLPSKKPAKSVARRSIQAKKRK